MDKLIKALIYIFILFLIESPIWNNSQIINYLLLAVMLIIDIIIIIKTPKNKFKPDRIDILLLSIPIIYILHTVFGLAKQSLMLNYFYINY